MDDDFEFPTTSNMEEGLDMDMDVPEDDDLVSPILKVGEEKEIGKNGLKKKLLKEGEGWETPASGDEVEGTIISYPTLCFFIEYLVFVSVLHCNVCLC